MNDLDLITLALCLACTCGPLLGVGLFVLQQLVRHLAHYQVEISVFGPGEEKHG